MDASEQTRGERAVRDTESRDEAFRLTYEQQRAGILRYALAWTRDPIAAEDACQEAFARLYRAMTTGQQPEMVGAWLRRVVRNLVISRARRAEVESRHAARLHEPVGHDPTARTVLDREELAAVRVALAKVPDAQRRLLLMAASGYSRAQLGQSLGASPGAIRTRLHRARRQLLGELAAADGAGQGM